MLGIAVPLAVRRLWPVPVFGLVLAMSVLAMVLGAERQSFVAAAFALYPVALSQPRRRWVPTPAIGVLSALAVLGGILVGVPNWVAVRVGPAVVGIALLGGAWTIGRAVRERRAYAARSATQLAERAVADQRLRIAWELHDIVAHSVGVVAVKAAVANHVLAVRPEEAYDALRVIETTSRTALVEMRQLVGVLRSDPDVGGTAAELTPAPGLAGLAVLADRAALAGVHVGLDVRGIDDLPGGVALSVYRIVQEALTNVVRHAAPARCTVTVAGAGIGTGREVRVQVSDDGPGARVLPAGAQEPSGHGLIGMRERVAGYGGTFTAGTLPGGGFGVSAREREVFTLIAGGLSNAEISEHLHVSAGTVKTHVGHLLRKLGARDRAQLVIVAYETGLVVVRDRDRDR